MISKNSLKELINRVALLKNSLKKLINKFYKRGFKRFIKGFSLIYF